MEDQIKELQNQISGVQTEIKLMNQTLQTVTKAFTELREINTKINDLELKLIVNSTKLSGGERFFWLGITAVVGIVASQLK